MTPHATEPRPDSGVDLLQHNSKRFNDWRDDFHRDGFAIVKNVITPERAEYYRNKQIEWLQSFGLGFDPKDESTWTADHLPVSFKGGMYLAYAATHEKFVWEARMERRVQETFADLWGTDELLSSFDGMNITLPRQKDLKWSPWPHCDQSPLRKGMQCVQGLLNYQSNGPKDGGLIVMKGSSKLYDQFFSETREQDNHEDKPPEDSDFKDLFIFKEEDVQWFKDHGCEIVKTCLEPGDLVSSCATVPVSHPDKHMLTRLFSLIIGSLGQPHYALRLLPRGRSHPTCAIHLSNSCQIRESRDAGEESFVVQALARDYSLAAL